MQDKTIFPAAVKQIEFLLSGVLKTRENHEFTGS